VTYTAHTISVVDGHTAGLRGSGLICSEARYISILWHGASRIERGFATPALWKDIEQQIAAGLPTGPLDVTTPIARMFREYGAQQVQWRSTSPVDAERPDQISDALDQHLRAASGSDS